MGGVVDHADALHLVGNLLMLAACWPSVANALGWRRAVILAGAAGIASNTVTAILIARPVIGASGAAAAALAAHLTVRPHGRLMGCPAGAVALAWLGSQTVFATLGPTYAGIAWPAHLIGAALGALGAQLLRRRCIART